MFKAKRKKSTIPRFNYIITIHNKEDMIKEVIESVLMCCRDNSFIYPVLDGCTDNTEKIIDSIIEKYSNVPIVKVYTPDVHELLSINAGLKVAEQGGEGFNIVLQDDVILADFLLEKKVIDLYKWGGEKLGYVSFRLGANFTKDAAISNEAVPMCDYCENAYGHGLSKTKVLLPGQFTYRNISIKSPVCFPFKLIREVGFLEERLAPYAHDDLEYAIRCFNAGYKNGVFAIKFYSDVRWGGTRTTPHPKMLEIHKRNIDNIRKWYGEEIKLIFESKKDFKIYNVPKIVDKEESNKALLNWRRNKSRLVEYQKNNQKKRTVIDFFLSCLVKIKIFFK